MFEAAVFCLAMNIYWEARSEPIAGQRMVAYVTMNRALWDKRLVCHTVFQDKQFSWANEKVVPTKGGFSLHYTVKPKEKEAWARSLRLAKQVIRAGKLPGHLDPSHGAKFYHADYIRQPQWAKQMRKVSVVGRHVFYRHDKQ